MNRQLLKGSIMFTGVSIITIALNFVFYFVGRLLSVEDFGLLVALISFSYLITVCQSILLNFFTKPSAEQKDLNISSLRGVVIRLEIVLTVLIIVGAILLQPVLKFSSYTTVIALISLPIASLRLSFYRAILRGRKQFKLFGITLIEEAFLKLALGFAAAVLGFGVNGIILGIGIAGIITYFNTKYLVEKNIEAKATNAKVDLTKLINVKHIGFIIAGFLIVNLMFVVDSIISRQNLSAYDAGIFAAVVTFGKIIFFLSSSVSNALLPLSTEKGANFTLLIQALAISMIIGFGAMIGVAILGDYAVQILFGFNYQNAAIFLTGEVIFVTSYTCVYQFTVYLIGKSKYRFIPILLIGFVAQLFVLLNFGKTITAIWQIQAITMILTLTAMFGFYFFEATNEKS